MQIALPRRLVERSAWVAISIVFGRGMFLVAGLVLARLLGAQRFGLFSTAQTTVTFLAFIVGYGLGQTATKVVTEADDREKAAFAASLSRLSTYCMLFVLPVVALVGVIAGKLVLGNATVTYLIFVLLGVPLGTMALLVSQGLLAGVDDFRGLAGLAFISGGAVLLSALAAALLTQTIVQAALMVSIGYAVSALACISITNRRLSERTKSAQTTVPISKLLTTLRTFAIPRSLYGGVPAIATWVFISLLAGCLQDYSEVGVFAIADQWFLVVMVVPAALSSAAFPTLTKEWQEGRRQEVLSLLRRLLLTNGGISLSVAGVFAFASPLIGLLYGEVFASRTLTFQLIFAAAAIAAAQVPAHYFLAAVGKAWWSFHIACSSTCVSILCAVWLLDHGSAGLAIARVAGFMVQALLMFAAIRWITNRFDTSR